MNLKILALLWLLSFASPLGAATETAPPAEPYRLEIVEERITARLTDVSVLELVEELGLRLGFEVVAQGVVDTRVSLDFEGLSPSEAIRAICRRVGYVEVPDAATGRTARLVLTPGSDGGKNRLAARREPLPPRPEPTPDPPPANAPDPNGNPPDPDGRPDTTH